MLYFPEGREKEIIFRKWKLPFYVSSNYNSHIHFFHEKWSTAKLLFCETIFERRNGNKCIRKTWLPNIDEVVIITYLFYTWIHTVSILAMFDFIINFTHIFNPILSAMHIVIYVDIMNDRDLREYNYEPNWHFCKASFFAIFYL